MTIQRYIQKAAFAMAVCAVMAGCASTQKTQPLTGDAYNKKLSDADALWKSGDTDKAIPLYQELAKNDPTREEPWSRIAQIQFSQAHYGQAIVAAQEALQRDDSDRQARSVLAVSGLRVATQSLEELRKDSALVGDATTDARILAQQLRDTLGEATLFPDEVKDDKPKSKKVVRRRTPARKATTPADNAAPAANAAGDSSGGGSSNPFGALK
ncbi:tetratricopeptide repeat protein [Robbsia andropogonis]|nr:tetratricopeptide repeat protein [Robbsia andropogonis]MCP1117299.1 tetratricopeptide repeat protein [Robbsia andropogonis]MCP1129306.1 tetratricopeptide repeat protein [Robbsia andropogonis]